MSKPLIVSIPHALGKQEAVRRLKSGLGKVGMTFGDKLASVEAIWSGDHCDFRARILGQATSGKIDVEDDHVRLEIQLPWLLAQLASRAKALIERQGHIMLEKK